MVFQEELHLIQDGASAIKGRSKEHEIRTAPIITRDAYVAAGYRDQATQYGVLGRVTSILYEHLVISSLLADGTSIQQ